MSFAPMMVLGLVGTAVSAMGAMAQANAAAAAANYNAEIAERNAQAARISAASEAAAVKRKTDRQLGTARAAIGASGVTVEGTPLDVLAETAALGETDRQMVLWKGENQAVGYESEAELNRMQASSARTAGMFGAASSLLTGFGRAASGGGYGMPVGVS